MLLDFKGYEDRSNSPSYQSILTDSTRMTGECDSLPNQWLSIGGNGHNISGMKFVYILFTAQ